MKVEDNRMLLMCRYVLDDIAYNDVNEPVTWEHSSIREWLNGEFYESFFSEQEKKFIELTHLVNDYSDMDNKFITENDTDDYVFILSPQEDLEYSQYKVTEKGGYDYLDKSKSDTISEWIRSACTNDGSVSFYSRFGRISSDTLSVDQKCGVRPALWINLDY